MTQRPGLGDILVEEHLIAREQLSQAQRAAERLGSPLVVILLEQGLVSEDHLLEALCRRLELRLFDPLQIPVDPEAVREVPFEEANRYRLLPLAIETEGERRVLRVAMADPLDVQAIEDLECSTGCTVEPLIARPSQLSESIRNHYRGVVTKLIPRLRTGEPPVIPPPTLPRRRVFGGGLTETHLRTRPLSRAPEEATTAQRLEALLLLLQRKGLVTAEEYAEQLRSILRREEP